jgi:AraC family transcriptional regulator, activator of mtrCDE
MSGGMDVSVGAQPDRFNVKMLQINAPTSHMELLDRLLSLMPIAGRVDVRCHFGSPWRLDEPSAGEWEIQYHVLLRGEAVVELGSNGRSEPALRMRAGDIVLFPAGSAHTLHDGSGKRARAARKEHVAGLTIATNNSTREGADILCGRFVLPAVPRQLLRDHLPERLIVSSSPTRTVRRAMPPSLQAGLRGSSS